MPQDAIIQLIAKWINNSLPASSVDVLLSHISNERMESDEAYEIGEQLMEAINEG